MGVTADDEYPDFATDTDRHAWDAMSAERQQQYEDAVAYVLERHSEEQMSVALIGTVLTLDG